MKKILLVFGLLLGVVHAQTPTSGVANSFVQGASLPPSCSSGQVFTLTSTFVPYYCSAMNTWAAFGGGGGGGTVTTTGSPASGNITAFSGTSSITPATAANFAAASINGWTLNTNGTLIYAEASSMTRAPHSGGSPVGTALAGGGLSGNYIYLLSQSLWGAVHTTYYNDACDGSTTTQMVARYTTGSTTCTTGITVPAAHTVIAANTTAGNRSFYFIGLDACNNDQNSSISLATTTSNIQSLISSAQADGAIVVLMTSPAANFGGCVTLNQQASNGTIASIGPNLFIAPLNEWLSNGFNTVNFDPVGPHPNVAGHLKIGQNLFNMMVAGGSLPLYDQGYYNIPLCVQFPFSSTQTVCMNTDGTVTAPNGATINGVKMSNVPRMLFTTSQSCGLNNAFCGESVLWTPSTAVTITQFFAQLGTPPAGCSTNGTMVIKQNGSVLSTITFANGTQTYTNSGLSINATGQLQISVGSTAAGGCSTIPSGGYFGFEYIMQ